MALTDVLKKVYPFLSAFASSIPGGNIAATALGTILNLKSGATLDDAGLALMSATPEQRAALQVEDNRHKEQMTQMGFTSAEEFERIAAADRASARDREKVVRDKMPMILGLSVTAGFFGLVALMAFHPFPLETKDVFLILVGALTVGWKDVMGYFLGSSAGSAEKTRILAAQSEQK